MDNVQTSKYGDIVLTDGMSDEELEKQVACRAIRWRRLNPTTLLKITDINRLPTRVGWTTRNAYFTTNQTVPEIEDAPKSVKKQERASTSNSWVKP